MSREISTDEARERFLDHLAALTRYWGGADVGAKTCDERLDGLAFSILSAIDGGSGELPGWILAPVSSPEDTEFYISEGEYWWPENGTGEVHADIAGSLHESWATRRSHAR